MSTDARCDLTDLLVEMCSHCLGHEGADVVDLDAVAIEHTMEAKYAGRCALDARHQIDVGDRIGRTEHGWACTPCTAKVRPGR